MLRTLVQIPAPVYRKAKPLLSGFSIDKVGRVDLGNLVLPPTVKLRTNAPRREFAFLGKTPRNGISSRKRGRVKRGSTAHAARCLSQSLSALGCFSETLKRGVPLVYRNDDGVDTSTLPPIPYPDQRKPGQAFCPGFFPHFAADRPECSLQQGVPLPGRIIGAEARRPSVTRLELSDLPAHTASLCGFRAASLQRCALVVTRRSTNASARERPSSRSPTGRST